MPKFRITSPDGQSYEITAPEGATQEQVLAYAQQHHASGPQAPKESPADRYARLQKQAAAMPQSDGTGTDGENFLAGIGKSFVDTGRGAVQLGTDAARYFVEANPELFRGRSAGSLVSGKDDSLAGVLRAKVEQQQKDEAERRRRDAPLMGTKAGLGGNIAGTAAQIITPGIALRGTAAASTFLPRTIAGNAVQGGVIGLAQPVTSSGERVANGAMGLGAGAILPAVPKLASIGVRAAKNAALAQTARGAEREAVRTIQREASNPGRLLVPNPSKVPGATRTLFEETLDPGVARLETRARGMGGGFAERDSANNAARSRVIENIAGDDAAMAAADRARTSATSGLRNQAYAEGDESAVLGMQAGFSPVENVASLKAGINQLAQAQGGRSSVQRALADVVSELDGAEPSVQGLYNVRKSINDLIQGKAGSDKAYAKAATRELIQARELVDAEIANLAPSFNQYLDAYKTGSIPINRMELGQTLLDSGSGAIVDPTTGAYRLTPGVFGRQVKNLDQVAQRATGFGKAKAADILTPADMAGIDAVNDDLARQAQRLLVGSGGNSHTASQAELGKRVIARSLIRVIPGFKAATEFLEQAGAKRLNGALEEVLSDPAKYRAVALHLSQPERRLIEQALVRIGGTSGALSPALAE